MVANILPFRGQIAENKMADQLIENLRVIVLVSGLLADNSPYYAYVLIRSEVYMAFKQAEAKGDYDLAQYGEIIAHGHGLEPDAITRKQVEDTYGADHTFEDKLLHTIEKINEGLFEATQ